MPELSYRGPLKPGPHSYEELVLRQFRIWRMIYLLVHGASYRAIARDLGVARTTVMRMAAEAASYGWMTRAGGMSTTMPGTSVGTQTEEDAT